MGQGPFADRTCMFDHPSTRPDGAGSRADGDERWYSVEARDMTIHKMGYEHETMVTEVKLPGKKIDTL
jgi:hypothetical protein